MAAATGGTGDGEGGMSTGEAATTPGTFQASALPHSAPTPIQAHPGGRKDAVLSVERGLEASPCRKPEPGAEDVAVNVLLPHVSRGFSECQGGKWVWAPRTEPGPSG